MKLAVVHLDVPHWQMEICDTVVEMETLVVPNNCSSKPELRLK